MYIIIGVIDCIICFLVIGDRFYSFLHHFSLYILTKVMYRDHGKIVVYSKSFKIMCNLIIMMVIHVHV